MRNVETVEDALYKGISRVLTRFPRCPSKNVIVDLNITGIKHFQLDEDMADMRVIMDGCTIDEDDILTDRDIIQGKTVILCRKAETDLCSSTQLSSPPLRSRDVNLPSPIGMPPGKGPSPTFGNRAASGDDSSTASSSLRSLQDGQRLPSFSTSSSSSIRTPSPSRNPRKRLHDSLSSRGSQPSSPNNSSFEGVSPLDSIDGVLSLPLPPFSEVVKKNLLQGNSDAIWSRVSYCVYLSIGELMVSILSVHISIHLSIRFR